MTPPSASATVAADRHKRNSDRTLYEKAIDWLTQQGVSTVLLFLVVAGIWLKLPEIMKQNSEERVETITQFREERKLDRDQHKADEERRDRQVEKLATAIKEQTATLMEEFRRVHGTR